MGKRGPDTERCSPAMTMEIHMGWDVPEWAGVPVVEVSMEPLSVSGWD